MRNGYRPQLDSKDDQKSISHGVDYAKKHNYRKINKNSNKNTYEDEIQR